MILDKKAKIKITRKNIDHYSRFFINLKLKDIIEIDIEEHLMKSSNLKINVQCDVCSIKRIIKYQAYNKNISSCQDHPIYTCDKCSHIKLKSTNQKKYGTDYFSQTNLFESKFKSSMRKKYGVEYALQSKELREKAKQTNLNKYGVENPFQSEEIKEKIKNTIIDKYGYSHIQSVPEIKDKIKKTNLSRHGVEYPMQSKEIRMKSAKTNVYKFGNSIFSKTKEYIDIAKKTNLEKWGHEWTLQSPEIRSLISKTNLEKYGVDNPMKSEEIRRDMIISNDPQYVRYIGESISLFDCQMGHEFEIDIDLYHSRSGNGTPLCTVCNPIGDSRSIKENDLFEFIKSIYQGEIIQSYKDGLEIDIYLPILNLGFEFNGLYWHSEEFRPRRYHIDKTNYFEKKGIRIIHIWEDDWTYRGEIIKSQIRNWIGDVKERIFARKCKIREVSSDISKEFLDLNHVQGSCNSIKQLGLYFNDELVSIMTFDHSEGRKKMPINDWNLSRFCNKLNTSIIGGASKLFQFFIRNYSPLRVISYADRNWSNGNLYFKLGFSHISNSKEDYKYVVENRRIHKSRFRKSKLDTNLSESEYMRLNSIPKIWDCGKMKFELKN